MEQYKVVGNKLVKIIDANREKHIRYSLDSSYQGVKRFFVFAYDNTVGYNQVSVDSYQRYLLPRIKIENYNIEIDGRIFMISRLMTQLSNTTKSEKYQQDKGMIIQQLVYWILFILKTITD